MAKSPSGSGSAKTGRGSRKRAFGEANQLPSGRYRARFSLPGGERISAPLTFVTRLDAEYWLAEQERALSRGDWQPPTKPVRSPDPAPAPASTDGPLLRDYATEVLQRRRLRPTTKALYDKLLRLAIVPAFGDRTLPSITTTDITHWYASQDATPTQQANAYGLLKSILKDAVEDELIDRNPCRVRGGSQKQPAHEIQILTFEQLDRYLNALPEPRRIPLLLAAWCGLRSGEVRGLRVQDLDLDRGVVHVRQAVVRLTGQLLITPPKTRAGVRTIAIPPHLLPGLRVWANQQPQRPPTALLFPASDGDSPLNDSVLRDAHDKGRAAIGMPGLTIHGLRHTSATIAAQFGATIAELQARIGHTTPNMAMRYQHVAADRDTQLARRISEHITGKSD